MKQEHTDTPDGVSTALLTDLYQLTMAYGYWKEGLAEREAVFHLFFRENPFQGGYTLVCGLETVVQFLQNFQFDAQDLDYLSSLTGSDDAPMFSHDFLEYLKGMAFSCSIHAMPEGSVAFPHEPLLRIRGPLLQAQLLETGLLNTLNFQSLVATKAARICQAAKGEPVLEFGLRRAQGVNGAMVASRAAYIGGCAATSNVMAGRRYGLPVKGTHAHSWVMAFEDELEAFQAYADAMPNNCVFLVDTYDTLQGVRHAIEVGKRLRVRGYEMGGIRLDSGDLAALSQEARKLLDAGGFKQADIVASNDLDEYRIQALKQQGATIGVWGVGTRLVTAYDQPALGGVYKLSALRSETGAWEYRLKLSEERHKSSLPGILQVRRYLGEEGYEGDIIYHEHWSDFRARATSLDGRPMRLKGRDSMDVLQPVFDKGKLVYLPVDIHHIRSYAQEQLACLDDGIKAFSEPKQYPVGLENKLQKLKVRLSKAY